jgi:hypothetical protein
MVLDLRSLRVIEANVSEGVRAMVLAWAGTHQQEVIAGMWQPTLPQALASSNRACVTA